MHIVELNFADLWDLYMCPEVEKLAVERRIPPNTLEFVPLATQHFGPMAAVPCAISACLHSLLGSILAWYFSSKDADTDDTTTM